MKDKIICNTECHFGLWDRFKILLGRTVTVTTEMESEHEDVKLIGKTKSIIRVSRLIPLRKRYMEYTDSPSLKL